MKQSSKKFSQIWDLKEKYYPRFNEKKCDFEKNIISITKEWGVDYSNKSIFEVGSGTGIYTFLLAKMAKAVVALDFSKQMLAILKKDAIRHNLNDKITCVNSDFLNFENNEFYDIAFGAMTPALSSKASFNKFNNLAKTKVWLGWAGKRNSKIMREVFKSHNQELRVNNTSSLLKQWLDDNSILYKNRVLETSWENELSLDDMVEDQAWYLKMQGREPNAEVIKKALIKFIDENNKILNKTDVRLEIVVW